ncbi:Phosphatidylinositol 4-kinase pik1alpha (PI4-kinase)(PtdIns-4-kinase), partial [Rhizophlyctis rosea]
MLVTRATESVALEDFILDRCQHSSHIALLTLWYLQAYLSTLRSNPPTRTFRHCQRIYHKLQSIIFADTSPEEDEARREKGETKTIERSSSDSDTREEREEPITENGESVPNLSGGVIPKIRKPIRNLFSSLRVRENTRPAFVGIGAIAAAIGGPALFDVGRNMIVAQGRRGWSGWEADASVDSLLRRETGGRVNGTEGGGDDVGEVPTPKVKTLPGHGPRRVMSFRELSKQAANGRDDTSIENDNGAISPTRVGRRLSYDSRTSPSKDPPPPTPKIFHPALLATRIPTGSPSLEDLSRGHAFTFSHYVTKTHPLASLQKSSSTPVIPSSISASSHPHLRTSYYFHVQLQFVLTLIDIGDRLRSVPKEARQSSLVAELTLLNYNLPAEVCLVGWCGWRGWGGRESDNNDNNDGRVGSGWLGKGHHRVVRISPGDAVVLNSADRVPYLINVEVVSPDEDLSRQGEDVPTVEDSGSSERPSTVDDDDDDEGWTPTGWTPTTTVRGGVKDGEDRAWVKDDMEAIDLNNESSGENSIAPTTTTDPDPRSSAQYHQTVLRRRSSIVSAAAATSPPPPPTISSENEQPSSVLDDFSERMRTAAVMLAQLYQQQQREMSGGEVGGVGRFGLGGAYGSPSIPPIPSTTLSSNSDTSTPTGRKPNLKPDYEAIRARLVREMMVLEEKRVRHLADILRNQRKGGEGVDGEGEGVVDADAVLPEEEERVLREGVRDRDDPSAASFRESWHHKKRRIRSQSPFGNHPSWDLISVIVKSGADLRQEQLALQLIGEMQRIWAEDGVPVWVCFFRILPLSSDAGLIETIPDAISVHSIKKHAYSQGLNQPGLAYTLYDYFVAEFGGGSVGGEKWRRAQDAFMRSLAGYCVVCYLLGVKDRHNGNILLNTTGHIIHIDFGFMLSNAPGGVPGLGFELAPFKLPQEYVDILGGVGSAKFQEFRTLVKWAFLSVRKRGERVWGVVEVMERDSTLPCFTGYTTKPTSTPTSSSSPPTSSSTSTLSPTTSSTDLSPPQHHKYPVTAALKDRFHLTLTEHQLGAVVDGLIDRSLG